MLMDAVQVSSIDFEAAIEIRTVHTLLESQKCLDLLNDKQLISEATKVLESTSQLQSDSQRKTNARQQLSQKYVQSNRLSSDQLSLILDSITVKQKECKENIFFNCVVFWDMNVGCE